MGDDVDVGTAMGAARPLGYRITPGEESAGCTLAKVVEDGFISSYCVSRNPCSAWRFAAEYVSRYLFEKSSAEFAFDEWKNNQGRI